MPTRRGNAARKRRGHAEIRTCGTHWAGAAHADEPPALEKVSVEVAIRLVHSPDQLTLGRVLPTITGNGAKEREGENGDAAANTPYEDRPVSVRMSPDPPR
jgi:hypothetical protein